MFEGPQQSFARTPQGRALTLMQIPTESVQKTRGPPIG